MVDDGMKDHDDAADTGNAAPVSDAAVAPAAPPSDDDPNPHAITRQDHEAAILAEIEAVWEWASGQVPARAIRDQALTAAIIMRRAAKIPAVMEHLARLRHHLLTESDDAAS